MLRLCAIPYTLQFRRPAPTSRGTLTMREIWLLRAILEDAPARVGYGEAGPVAGLSRDDSPQFGDAVRALCIEINERRLPDAADALAFVDQLAGAQPSLAFGLETALRDLSCGGHQRLWETAFARGDASLPTHGLIWMDDTAGILRQIDAKVAAGFPVIKMKIGALPFDDELALLQTVRATYPGIELRLDANGAFSAAEAKERVGELAGLRIAFVEQPIQPGQWDALADLSRHSPVPIALDEELIAVRTTEQRRALLDSIRPHTLILKPSLLGGFASAEAWIADADERGIRWNINSLLESNIGLNAICQWTSAVGGEQVHGLGTGALYTNNIPAPISLTGSRLAIDPLGKWQWPDEAAGTSIAQETHKGGALCQT